MGVDLQECSQSWGIPKGCQVSPGDVRGIRLCQAQMLRPAALGCQCRERQGKAGAGAGKDMLQGKLLRSLWGCGFMWLVAAAGGRTITALLL